MAQTRIKQNLRYVNGRAGEDPAAPLSDAQQNGTESATLSVVNESIPLKKEAQFCIQESFWLPNSTEKYIFLGDCPGFVAAIGEGTDGLASRL